MKPLFSMASWLIAAALCAGTTTHAQVTAPVTIDGAWARATVAGQKATGAFMRLTAAETTRLVRVESPSAGVTEIHEMTMSGNIMKMRAIAGLDLPAGKAVELKPGSYHIMLMDLKAPLTKGTQVPLTLVFQNAQGTESQMKVDVPATIQAHGHGH